MHLTLKKAGNTLKDKKETGLEVNKYNQRYDGVTNPKLTALIIYNVTGDNNK